jgi:hypothetical protein
LVSGHFDRITVNVAARSRQRFQFPATWSATGRHAMSDQAAVLRGVAGQAVTVFGSPWSFRPLAPKSLWPGRQVHQSRYRLLCRFGVAQRWQVSRAQQQVSVFAVVQGQERVARQVLALVAVQMTAWPLPQCRRVTDRMAHAVQTGSPQVQFSDLSSHPDMPFELPDRGTIFRQCLPE